MLDLGLIRKNPEKVKLALLKRMDSVDFTKLLELDDAHRKLISLADEKKNQRNIVSKEISELKRKGINCSELISNMKTLSENIKFEDANIKELSDSIRDIVANFPNIPLEDVVQGGKENNQEISRFKDKPLFDFNILNHVEIASNHNLIEYERGARSAGNGFWFYKGVGAQLEWALLNYFVNSHLNDNYQFILPPHILSNKCGFNAGQFPKFEDEVYKIVNGEKESTHFLIPTSETALVNFFANEILDESELPKKMFAYSPCYRPEAGSYRSEERGMIRGHQFNKVEMFQFTTPNRSNNALEELLEKAEKLVKGLDLHYRVSKLAAKDCSASMAKTLDIEIWIPSMNQYKEVSSVSNGTDFQARRANIKYKNRTSGKNEYVHTLNGSGLATSRLIPAIIEQNQQSDGSVIVPEVLQKIIGTDRLIISN